jgi:hypothetical protein
VSLDAFGNASDIVQRTQCDKVAAHTHGALFALAAALRARFFAAFAVDISFVRFGTEHARSRLAIVEDPARAAR